MMAVLNDDPREQRPSNDETFNDGVLEMLEATRDR